MIKKFILVVLSNLLIVLFLTSCGKKEENTSAPNTTTSATNTQTQTKQDTPPPPKVSQAEETVKNWINALGNRNFKEAHRLMTSKKGGDYSKFSSNNGYGGINKTNILSCKVDSENESNAEVVAEYESFDPINRDGKFKQRFILVKEGNNWLISEIKKIDIAFYNEKKVEEKQVKETIKETPKKEASSFSFIGSWSGKDNFYRVYKMIIGPSSYYFSYEGINSSGTYKQKGDKLNLTDQYGMDAGSVDKYGSSIKVYLSGTGEFTCNR